MKPTTDQFTQYQAMFDHFNSTLFDGMLPHVLLNFSRDKKRAVGYFAPERWGKGEDHVPEITLNPDHLTRGALETASTLVHEMVHMWQHVFGKPSRTGYHNAQWAEKMEQVGLMPSSTGKLNGRRVGQKMSHYVITDGAFAQAFAKLSHTLPWTSEARVSATKYDRTKKKYVCPTCKAAVWGKPSLNIGCLDCKTVLVSQ